MGHKLLVVTPTLGRSAFMGQTVSSLQSLGGAVFYAVVTPLAAVPEVQRAVSAANGRSLEVRLVVEPPACGGLYPAINHAVKQCGDVAWDYVTYINDDDAMGPDFAAVWAEHARTGAQTIGYGEVNLIDEAGAKICALPIEPSPRWFEALLAQGINPLNQQGMIIPRAIWEKLGGFRPEYKLCADLDFWLRAKRLDWPFQHYRKVVGLFRIRPGQLSGNIERLTQEIAAVVARDVPGETGGAKRFYARWQFRLKNFPTYWSRLVSGRQMRGMKILGGGG